jgi:hypothetical protein
MASLLEHPTVKRFHELNDASIDRLKGQTEATPTLEAGWLRQLCLDAGADDVGFVELEQLDERDEILRFFPKTKALISFVLRMNREPIRSPARSVANVEFHQSGHHVDEIAHHIVAALGDRGVRATNAAMGFPMEMDRVGAGKLWGRVAQTNRRRRRSGSHGHSSKCDSPEVRKFHFARHCADECGGN